MIKFKDHGHLHKDNTNPDTNEHNYPNEQCYQVSSTTNNNIDTVIQLKSDNNNEADAKQTFCFSNPKYKNQMMEKYLRDLDGSGGKEKCGLELSKWLESAAKFTPDKNNYIEWESKKLCSKQSDCQDQYLTDTNIDNIHQKEELDAAEALTFLASNFKSRWVK